METIVRSVTPCEAATRSTPNWCSSAGVAALLIACGACAADESSSCTEGALGGLQVTVSGLPVGVDASLEARGGSAVETFVASGERTGLASGVWTVVASAVPGPPGRVREWYAPTATFTQTCVSETAMAEVTVRYAAIPTSGKLWVLSDDENQLQGFSADQLSASHSDVPAALVSVPAGTDVAFDREGNLWTFGPTTAEPLLLRYPAAAFAPGATPAADREIDIVGVSCFPRGFGMAFDHHGALWVSTCGETVWRLDAVDLAASGAVTPAVSITGVTANRDVAFDGDGNLWVTSDGKLSRYEHDRLASSTGEPADKVITIEHAANTTLIAAEYLTFDATGDLFATDFGGNFVTKILASDLLGTGAVTAKSDATITLSVSALLNRPALDDDGGLWISYSAGKVARIAPAALLVDTGAGAPTTPDVELQPDRLGNTANVAFFPAAEGLPLYHALPAP